MVNEKIASWMEAHREEYLQDMAQLIAIPSIAEDTGDEGAPYGKACLQVLHFMLALGEKYGFQTENIENRVGRIIYSPETDQDIGVWGHLDVVPPGNGWQQEDPFRLRREGDWMLGRGVRDNKGPTLAVLYAMRCMKDMGIACPRGLSLYMGCSEETGLKDVIWYVDSGHRCPNWSLVVDSAWPMTRGEKGMLSVDLYSEQALPKDVVFVQGGFADNAVPADAWVILAPELTKTLRVQGQGLTEESLPEGWKLSAKGRACHSAFPQGGQNAIGMLTSVLAGTHPLWEAVHSLSATTTGEAAGIQASDPLAGELTCVATSLKQLEGNRLKLHLNIRYPAITSGAAIKEGLQTWCAAHNWRMETVGEMEAYMLPLEHPMVVTLMDVYNDIMETDAKPFILAGGTYAGRLPNAVGYGMGGIVEPDLKDFLPPGHGHPHGPDECAKVSTILRGASIYTEALCRLSSM